MPSARMDKSTPSSPRAVVATVFVMVLAVIAPYAAATPTSQGFDTAFQDFLYKHSYTGGSVAAMKDGRLLFAKGFGVDRDGNDVTAHSKFHMSSLAKSLTGVAIMRLVQEGRIKLDDRVFGESGILADIQPWRRETVDARLQLMTVEHLLRHSCGWDTEQGPLYDPLLNKLYLERGHDVPDIARQMDTPAPLQPEDLISYVISQPLAFTPGTRTAYSNIAYLVLGRVVEAAAQTGYKEFVKKYILEPCGMWNTRLSLAPGHAEHRSVFSGGGEGDSATGDQQPLYRAVDPVYADSTLGWFSTVYDLMRFTRCTFDTGQILNDQHLELLLAQDPESHTDTWYTAGFRANTHGIIWQDGDQHADDLILYHDMRPPTELSLDEETTTTTTTTKTPPATGTSTPGDGDEPNAARSRRGWAYNAWDYPSDEAAAAAAAKQQLARDKARVRARLPESWVVLLHGRNVRHLRHYTRELMTQVDTSQASLPRENLFLYDLSDLHRHPSWKPHGGWDRSRRGIAPPEVTVRYHVDEHHLSAYVDALQDEGLDVHWFTSFTRARHTSFLVVGRRILRPARSQYDFVLQHGLDHRRLLKNKLWLERGGYNLTQLHSYTSFSHSNTGSLPPTKRSNGKRGRGWRRAGGVTRFAALFRYEAFPQGTQMKYGTGHLPEPYHKLVQMYHEKEFYPVSQTVTYKRGPKAKEEVAFVFIKRADPREPRTEFRQQYDLSVPDLTKATASNTRAERHLAYLNSYTVNGDFRFSAVYSNNTHTRGLLETGQPEARASEITISNLNMGLAPKFIVPYVEASKLKYIIYYEEF